MKLSIPLTIVAIICIIALEQIEAIAFNATIGIFVFFSQCKVWATDSYGNIVMDTGWLNCEDGDPSVTFHSRDIKANPYWLHAKVMGSKRKPKHRGPFSLDTCFKLTGNVFKWSFDQQDLTYCT